MAAQGSSSSDGQLALDESELRLPWLEAADEDFEEGLDWRRVGRFAAFVLGAAVLAALLFWLLRDWSMRPPEADGSVIAAPETPYKVRPENPGGKEFAGTGDTSYSVGEGIAKESRVRQADAIPDPAQDDASETPAPAPEPEPAMTGVGVQVGAYSSRADANKGWQTLRQRYERLGDFDHRILEGRADIGNVFRLQAVTGNLAAANALCRDLRANGIECQVKR